MDDSSSATETLIAGTINATDYLGAIDTAMESHISPDRNSGEVPTIALDSIDVTLAPHSCGPCTERGRELPEIGTWFCRDCVDYLCDDCKALHDIFYFSPSHHLSKTKEKEHLGSLGKLSNKSESNGSKVNSTSDLTEEIQVCEQCREKVSVPVKGTWYCKTCCDYLCDDCKSLHGFFYVSEAHDVVSTQGLVGKSEEQGSISTMAEAPSLVDITDGAAWTKTFNNTNHLAVEDKNNNFSGKIEHKRAIRRTVKKVPFTECSASFVLSFDVSLKDDAESPDITSSAFLPDSRLLLVDRGNKKIKVFDTKYKCVRVKKFLYRPWSVAVFNEEETAVTFGNCFITRMVVRHSVAEKGTIVTKFNSWGVVYTSRHTLAVSGVSEVGIVVLLKIDGTELERVALYEPEKPIFSCPWYITLDLTGTILYVSDCNNNAIHFIDLKTRTKTFTYTHETLKGPVGMAIDVTGNIYVSGCRSNNITQITPSGKHCKVLLSEKDRLDLPQTIAFIPGGDDFLVGSNVFGGASGTVEIYDMV